MLVEGISALRVCKLNHKSEAIRAINNRLESSGGKISDEVVGTVLALASFEVRFYVNSVQIQSSFTKYNRISLANMMRLSFISRH